MRLLLISDTHVPQRARRLPDEVWDAVDHADMVFHAGDWTDTPILDQLASRATRLIGVYGNNDGPELRRRLPEIATETVEGVRFAMVHETGGAAQRDVRMAAAFPDTDVLVFGHSHIPWDTVAPNGLRLLNPGSCSDRRREPFRTYLTLTVADSVIDDVNLHRIPNGA